MTLLLGRQDVEELLPMAECVEVVAEALATLARGDATQPLRSVLWLPDRRGLMVSMPAATGAGEDRPALVGSKVLSVFQGNAAHGLESHQGFLLLFEAGHGSPLAILDAAAITAVRTAAASAVATRCLARRDAGDLALLGSGVQARTHLEAMQAVRPLRRVRVWSRSVEGARRFAERESARLGLAVEAVGTAREAVAGADLICAVTAATEPVLAGDWIAPGAHVNAVGACTPVSRELDTAAVARARLFVDRRESALAEAGDLLIPIASGELDAGHIAGEVGDLLLGRVAGRRSDEEVTLFKSLGIAVEDLAAGYHVYRRAVDRGRGVAFPGSSPTGG